MIQQLSLLCFAIAISLVVAAQHTDDPVDNSRIVFLLDKFKTSSLDSAELSEIKSLTYKIQNKGFTLGENDGDYSGSLQLIDRSLVIWTSLRDSSNEANLRKFKGLILGKLNRFEEAKIELDSAVKLYTRKNQLFGVAVSHFDLSKVYEMQSMEDSAIFYVKKAIGYWQERQDTSRLVLNKNQLLYLYGKKKLYNEAVKVQREMGPLLVFRNLFWRHRLDYYFLSANLYRKMKQLNIAGRYTRLYDIELATLKIGNIDAKPGYTAF